MSQADSRVIDAATVCLLYAVRIDNVRADALVNRLEARGLLRLLISAVKSGASDSAAAGGTFESSLLVVRRIATARDSLYSLFAAALEREHSAATRMLDPLAPQDESESALEEDDAFLWPLTDRVVSLVEVLAAAFDVWFADGTPAQPALTLIPLRSVACLGSMLRSVRRRLMVLAFGSSASDSVALERGARFCAQLCALVAAAAADGAEWQEAMTRAPDVCDSIIELLRVVAHVEARVPGANFAHIKRELLRALANLLSNHSVMLADHIAAVGGVELLLNSTRVVDSNPYASQWAIVALRYACEVSAPVRDVIVSLRRDGLVSGDASAVKVQVQDDGSIRLSTPGRDENCND